MKVGLRVLVVPFVLGVLALVGVAGCAAEVISVPSPPTKARYQISFPSTRVAVAAESLQVSVFDATNGAQAGTDCLSLITKQKSKADLPKALAQTDVVPICDLLAATPKGGLPNVSYGKRTLLAVVKRANADFFIGCAEAEISTADGLVDISVSQSDATVQVPATTCTTLSEKCRAACN